MNKTNYKNSKEKEKSLLMGLGERYRDIALEKKKQLKINRKRNIKLLKTIGLNKKISKQLAIILERSGCTLEEQRIIIKHFKRLLIDFKRDLHSNLELGKINLNRLPYSLRKLIIALIVLKAEIAHLFRLNQERQRKIYEKNNISKNSIDDYFNLEKTDLNLDNHELYRMGVSLSKGNYEGPRDFKKEEKQNDFSEKKMNFDFNITKKTKNKTDEKQQNEKQYYTQQMYIESGNNISKNNFSNKNEQYNEQEKNINKQ